MVSVVEDIGTGRGKPAGVGGVFKGDGPGNASLWIRAVGDDPYKGCSQGYSHHRLAR